MDSTFPGVIDLNVSGTHYRTLLSTLTKDEDSELAAMFTGRKPVHKDKDGRYFIEANPVSFKAILHFLLYDELPFKDTDLLTGFGGLGRPSLFGTAHGYARDIEMLYKDSLNLGLKKLSEALLLFEPNFVNAKMDEYRQTIRGYDKTIGVILDIVPAESLFHKTKFTIRIKQDLQTIEDEKCCDHDCKTLIPAHFSNGRNINAIVKVPFEVNPTILSAFVIDFQKRGYIVQGELAMCGFECQKEVKQSKYVVFGNNKRNCCTENLFLLHFRWELETHVDNNWNVFGMKNTTFGQVPQNKGFSFGTPVQNQQSNVNLFGQGNAFGNIQPTAGFDFKQKQMPQTTGGFSLGGGQQGSESSTEKSGFFRQDHGFGKGIELQQNQEQQQSLFGKAPLQQGSSLFGSSAVNNQQNVSAGGKNVFGGSQQSLFGQNQNVLQKASTPSFSFGSPKSQTSFFGQSGQSLFGKTLTKDQHVFGSKPVFQNNFGSPQQTTVTVSPDPGSAVTSSAEDKQEVATVKPAFSFGGSN